MRRAQLSTSQPFVATSNGAFISQSYSRTAATCAACSENAAAMRARV
jgi:hypothetical protein